MKELIKKIKQNILGERKEQVCITVDIFDNSFAIIKNINFCATSRKIMNYISDIYGLEKDLLSFNNINMDDVNNICNTLILIGLEIKVNTDHNRYKKYELNGNFSLRELKNKINN